MKNSSPVKIGWLPPLHKLDLLHERLYLSGRITCSSDELRQHFISDVSLGKKLNWYGSSNELVHFFSAFSQNEIIPPHHNINHVISSHFSNKGNVISPRVLSASKSRAPLSDVERFIDSIINIILKEK